MKSDEFNELEYGIINDDYEISPLLSMVNVVILESCRDEVDLLNSPYRNAINEEKNIVYIPIEKRFGFSDDVILEQNMRIRLASTQSEHSRLDRILTLLKDILEYGISDLLENGSFHILFQAVENIKTMNNDEFQLISNFTSNYNVNSKLTDEALTDRLEALDHIREVDDKIYHIKGEYEAFLQEAAVKYHTLLNWERSRYEQNFHFHKIREKTCEKSIEERKRSIKDEKIASGEMLRFYVEHIKVSISNTSPIHNSVHQLRLDRSKIQEFEMFQVKDLRADILKWMTKYDEDMDTTDLSIMKQKIKVEEMQTELRKLQQEILNRDKEMQDWIELKTQRKKEAIRNCLREWAAIKIQRWWRNILQEIRKNKKKKKKKGTKKKSQKK